MLFRSIPNFHHLLRCYQFYNGVRKENVYLGILDIEHHLRQEKVGSFSFPKEELILGFQPSSRSELAWITAHNGELMYGYSDVTIWKSDLFGHSLQKIFEFAPKGKVTEDNYPRIAWLPNGLDISVFDRGEMYLVKTR